MNESQVALLRALGDKLYEKRKEMGREWVKMGIRGNVQEEHFSTQKRLPLSRSKFVPETAITKMTLG